MFKQFGLRWFNTKAAANTTVTSQDEYLAKALLPILSVAQLLHPHGALLSQINELAGLSNEAFSVFYQAPMQTCARLLQRLPAFPLMGDQLLPQRLQIGLLALRIRRSYLLSAHGGAEEIARKQDLWSYAVFTSALCHNIGLTITHLRVDIYRQPKGDAIEWSAWRWFMDEQGTYYRYTLLPSRSTAQAANVTLLLLHLIIPKLGMQWLASDAMIFEQWLATVSDDHVNAKDLGNIIRQAEQQFEVQHQAVNKSEASMPVTTQVTASQKIDLSAAADTEMMTVNNCPAVDAYDDDALQPGDSDHLSDEPLVAEVERQVITPPQQAAPTLSVPKPNLQQMLARAVASDAPPKLPVPPAINHPEVMAFIDWLRASIEQRSLALNEPGAPIQVVAEGVLLATPAIFQRYAIVKAIDDWRVIQKQVLKQNWHRKTNGVNIVRYQVSGSHKTSSVNGLLIAEAAIIFGDLRIPQPNPHLTLLRE